MSRRIAQWLAAGFFVVFGAVPQAHAQFTWAEVSNYSPPPATPVYSDKLVVKQGADECFNGIGVPYPPINADGTCPAGVPKHNYSYVWGMTQAGLGLTTFTGDEIWWGTMSNPLCAGSAADPFQPIPYQNVAWVCEYGKSQGATRPNNPLPASAGDWRMPHVFSYNLTSGKLTDRTPTDKNFQTIFGLRSAGSIATEVMLAGPTFGSGVTFASWDAAAGTYHGSCHATSINQIRQWIVVNGVLYAGAGLPDGSGYVLRWAGSVGNPWAGAAVTSPLCGFQVVAKLPAFPAYLANFNGKRLAASTWNKTTVGGNTPPPPKLADAPEAADAADAADVAGAADSTHGKSTVNGGAGVFLGPPFDADGTYGTGDAGTAWTQVWSPTGYEPDPIVASTTGGGAMTFWNGWLWWGTMNNNEATASLDAECTKPTCYGKTSNFNDYTNMLFNVSRGLTFWRARFQGSQLQVQMLYGETQLPALVPGTKTFQMVSTGWTPLYGHSGFGNPWAAYTWSISAGTNDLLVGTYDYRYVFDVRLNIATSSSSVDPARGYGADLWRFADANSPATLENSNGLANFSNYGFRNLLRVGGTGPNVIVGTANGEDLAPSSGWELHLLTPKTQAPAAP